MGLALFQPHFKAGPWALRALWRELIAAGTSWRELLQDLELRLDLDLGSEDDFEDREYVRGLFEAEYAEAMSYEGHD